MGTYGLLMGITGLCSVPQGMCGVAQRGVKEISGGSAGLIGGLRCVMESSAAGGCTCSTGALWVSMGSCGPLWVSTGSYGVVLGPARSVGRGRAPRSPEAAERRLRPHPRPRHLLRGVGVAVRSAAVGRGAAGGAGGGRSGARRSLTSGPGASL